MRPIKFRAWDGELKRFGYINVAPYGIYWPSQSWMKFFGQEEGLNIEGVSAIDQFTGLRDKKGVEIYEGDIVQVVNGSEGIQTCEVSWKEDEFCWALKRGGVFGNGWWLYQFSHHCEECTELPEVIGNIHETPALLKDSGERE